MSLPWKSELQLRLQRGRCEARLLAPWSRRVLAEAEALGTPPGSIGAALQGLAAQGQALPAQARLLVPDEHTYLALRPPCIRWEKARDEARAHFEQTLGRSDLLVQVTPLPRAAGWLAAALEPADLAAWRDALAAARVQLASVRLALLDDLAHVAPRAPDDASIALLRDEGMSLLRLAGGVPVEICWERCDPHSLHCMEQRLLAFQKVGAGNRPGPMLVLCRDEAQREVWRRVARAHQWTLALHTPAGAPRGTAAPVEATA